MRIQKTQEVQKIVSEVVEDIITCNKCGHEVSLATHIHGYDFNEDKFHNFDCQFGYGSSFDMEHWSFDLCEDCLVELVKLFAHVPSGFKLDMNYNIIQDQSEEHQKIFEKWKETGKWDNLQFKSYKELVDLKDIFVEGYIDKVIAERFPDKVKEDKGAQ